MQSVIILGQPELTKEKLTQIIKENEISKFDVEVFSSEKAIGISDIKNLQKKIFLMPVKSEQKAVVLKAFLGITTEAQNAFLKILEEPPANTIILILVKSLDFVLPTILSRCNLINVSISNNLNIEEKLEYLELINDLITKKENPLFIAQKYGKEKEDALKFLEKLIIVSEEELLDKNSLSKIIKKLQTTYSLIKSTNVSVRFALENLFLNF